MENPLPAPPPPALPLRSSTRPPLLLILLLTSFVLLALIPISHGPPARLYREADPYILCPPGPLLAFSPLAKSCRDTTVSVEEYLWWKR